MWLSALVKRFEPKEAAPNCGNNSEKLRVLCLDW
nr:MAG TPA: hypothetical protein [Caudoviricetes sp.]